MSLGAGLLKKPPIPDFEEENLSSVKGSNIFTLRYQQLCRCKTKCSHQHISLDMKDNTWVDLVPLLAHSSYGLQAEGKHSNIQTSTHWP